MKKYVKILTVAGLIGLSGLLGCAKEESKPNPQLTQRQSDSIWAYEKRKAIEIGEERSKVDFNNKRVLNEIVNFSGLYFSELTCDEMEIYVTHNDQKYAFRRYPEMILFDSKRREVLASKVLDEYEYRKLKYNYAPAPKNKRQQKLEEKRQRASDSLDVIFLLRVKKDDFTREYGIHLADSGIDKKWVPCSGQERRRMDGPHKNFTGTGNWPYHNNRTPEETWYGHKK